MSDTLAELVLRLERIWIDPATVSLDELSAMLAERQTVLNQIQNADASALDPETKRVLAERIRAVRERDARILATLAAMRQDLEKGLANVMQARSAARGYGAGEEEGSPLFERTA